MPPRPRSWYDPHVPAPTSPFEVAQTDDLLTPALAILPAQVDANIAAVLVCTGGPDRWRPHIKTTKSAWALERLLSAGVRRVKCATVRELDLAGESGVPDVLLAYPPSPPSGRLAGVVAERHGGTRTSLLVDAPEHVAALPEGLGAFVDVDVGMGRTGVPVDDHAAVQALVDALAHRETPFRGLHAYDGHLGSALPSERRLAVDDANDRLCALVDALLARGVEVEEVVTSGTGTFRDALAHAGLAARPVLHTVGPGTLVYGDLMSAATLADVPGFAPAVAVLARVVSRSDTGRATLDAGSKALSVDQGVPHCAVVGRPWLEPLKPSEEHLPLRVADEHPAPAVGEVLAAIPRHVCTTVQLHDRALLVADGLVVDNVPVDARGRELPVAAPGR